MSRLADLLRAYGVEITPMEPTTLGTGRETMSVLSPQWPDPLGESAFRGLAGEIVRSIEPHSEADPAGLLVQLLVAVLSAGRRTTSTRPVGSTSTCSRFSLA
jgi:hypothetical protein